MEVAAGGGRFVSSLIVLFPQGCVDSLAVRWHTSHRRARARSDAPGGARPPPCPACLDFPLRRQRRLGASSAAAQLHRMPRIRARSRPSLGESCTSRWAVRLASRLLLSPPPQVPADILEDAALNRALSALPHNYSFEARAVRVASSAGLTPGPGPQERVAPAQCGRSARGSAVSGGAAYVRVRVG
jgi:hypothetical protein